MVAISPNVATNSAVHCETPVRVVVDGKERFRGFVTESAATLLETIGRRNDPEMYFSAQIDL